MRKYSAKDVTVVTISYNSSPILPEMITSLPKDTKLIVVDNAGSDRDQLRALASEHGFELIHNQTNRGFGEACNIGANAAKTEYVLLLNPDATLEADTLDTLLDSAHRNGPNAALGPKICNPDGSAHFKRRSVLIPRSEWLPRKCPETEQEVPVLSGSAIFATRDLFIRHQFDPRIFMYHEDDDWSLLVRKSGGKLILVPDAKVTHAFGHSSGRSPEIARFKAFHLARSRVFALRKHKFKAPQLRTYLHAIPKLLSPENFFSARKRAKNLGFFQGTRRHTTLYTTPQEMPKFWGSLPWWKVKREFSRLLWQITSLPRVIFDRFLITIWYDRFKAKEVKRFEGTQTLDNKVAIYLIFPKDGLLESHLRALAHIKDAGYAPLVVSNLPLSDDDISTLQSLAWKTIIRPNIGYDFGGYREGMLELMPRLDALEKVALLNDSSWFPIPNSINWLKEAEQLNVDFAGAATSFGIRRVGRAEYHSIQWEFDTSLSQFHYCSYAVLLGEKLLKDKGFRKYWRSYKLTAKKNKVVRYGEMGLSRFAIDNGFTHAATYDIRTLPESLSKCTDQELNSYAHNLVFLGEWIMKEVLDRVLVDLDASRSAADRNDVIKLLMATSARFGISYTMPNFLWEKHQFPFLKKSPVSLCKSDSDVMLSLATDIEKLDPSAEYIVNEMKKIRETKEFLY